MAVDASTSDATGAQAEPVDLAVELAGARAEADRLRIALDASEARLRALANRAVDDGTARERAESAVRDREMRLRVATEAAELGIFEWGVGADRPVWENDRMFEIFGLTREDGALTRETFCRDYLHPDDAQLFRQTLERTLEAGPGFHVTCRIRRKDGRLRWVDFAGTLERGADAMPLRIVGVLADITARKEAEDELRESEARFRAMADTSPAMLRITEPDGSSSFLSRAWYEYTGQEESEGTADLWAASVHGEDLDAARRVLREANARRESFQMLYRLRRRDGDYRWAIEAGRPRLSRTDDCLGFISSVIDIHERKLAEEALREADRRKDEFLATLAHELRNPLAPIRNAVQILRLQDSAQPELAVARNLIDRQVDHLVRLVDDLLDVSRITLGKIRLHRERLDLRMVVEEALATSRPLLEESRHRFAVELPRTEVRVDGDRVRLSQVVANLLNNAARYTPAGGEIRLVLRVEKEEAVIAVADNGIGIPCEMLSRVFDPFVQVDHGSGRIQGGLGIGLSLARSLVRMHEGSISAASDGTGLGSRFEVRLPLLPEPTPEAGSQVAGERAGVAPMRILIVDDNTDAANSQAMLLGLLGHRVETAFDGPSAIAKAAVFRPQLVLLDLGMPGMNGYDVARRLREDPESRDIVLVAQTGWGQEEDRRRTEEAGFDGHLTKPVDYSDLSRLLASLPARRAR